MMRMLHFLLALLLVVLRIVVLVQAQNPPGFISIDCGLPENSSYTEQTTGINYISDAKFIDSGVSKSISPIDKASRQQQLAYVRSFPSGARNCYRINVTRGTKYFIRATFYYGNYDGLNQAPEFDLHLGPNVWGTVKFPNASLAAFSEIIHTPSQNHIRPCLVNTGAGTPFISAIELRILNNNTYITNPTGLTLVYLRRFDIGSITNKEYRYSDDVYDRLWMPLTINSWTKLSTSLNADDVIQNDYRPPAVVLSTAATPVNASDLFDFSWKPDSVTDQLYFYMHFNEVVELTPNVETREFNILINGNRWYGPLRPAYKIVTTIFSRTASSGATSYQFTLLPTGNSTLPPILNAFEIYIAKDFSQSETQQDDIDAITNMKNVYGVARNWQGDPCAPITYMWEGLNCSFDGNNPPRITSLNLSSSNLTGEIASSISKLTMLEYLDLSNNNLSGPVPDFLTQMQSLKVLNLGKNNLTGVVPSGLLDRSKAVIPVVASVAGIVVLLAIVATAVVCGLKKRKPRATVNSHVEPNTPNVSQLESKQRQYTFNELTKITKNFDTILGRGGFGTVYHGLIDDTQVAVKMLSSSSVKLLMRVHHKNLTSLIGYCNEEANIGLIYEYMANGNLDGHLSGKNRRAKFLTWEDRLRIAVDAAQVVLLEIITSRPAITKGQEKTHISQWVSSMVSNGDIKNIVDSRLHEDFETSSVWKAVEIGMASVSINPARRPNTSEIVTELKECLAIELARKRSGRDTENNDSIELGSLNLTTEVGPLAR
ncbi:Serine-threonine/tyrosine-protein kinase, catalytic domain [Sesbania bispinosa]|nr:Serine-threonine/tyrosine-protein kinase, catalytic domain [Sesbania bispinosa]